MNSFISIIIISYNRERYLRAAIESVLGQSYRNFELLIWDDGSWDNSVEIGRSYEEKDSRVRVISSSHQGIAIARKKTAELARGKYIGWVDSDDFIDCKTLEKTVAVLEANPNVGLVYTDYLLADEDSKILGYSKRSKIPYSADRLLADFMTFHFRLIRREVYEKVGGVDENSGVAEDYDLCLRLSEVTEIQHLPEALYYYRQHSASISSQHKLSLSLDSYKAVSKALSRRGLNRRLSLDLNLGWINNRPAIALSFQLKTRCFKPISRFSSFSSFSFGLVSLSLLGNITATAIPTFAQSITPANDGTGTVINNVTNQNGNNLNIINITGGQRSSDGGNLFHSFVKFGLTKDEIANFQSNPNIQNIFTRVVGGNPSLINGLLQITGGNSNLFFINPAGVIFGKDARLNLPAAFSATTSSAIGFDSGWFNATGNNNYSILAGQPNNYAFTLTQPGVVVNGGNLGLNPGQNLTLLGGNVVNTGQISVPGGKVTLASVPGKNLVRFSQTGNLLSLDFQPGDISGVNSLPFTASSLPELLTGNGLATATGLSVDANGNVFLGSQTNIGERNIVTTPGTTIASGRISVSGNDRGGDVNILGSRVGVSRARVDASGNNGGGKVLIGGDFQGKGTVPNAINTFVSRDSQINVDALVKGDGGRVIAWANQNLGFFGNVSARGGSSGGNGGFVEASGKKNLIFDGFVDTSATNGKFGTLMLDPENILISNDATTPGVDVNLINILATDFPGQNITINATTLERQQGNIQLAATNNITIDPAISLFFSSAGFYDGGEFGSITFTADADNNGLGNFIMGNDQNIRARGRNLNIFGANITTGNLDTSGGRFGGGNILLNVANGNIIAGRINTSDSRINGSGNINGSPNNPRAGNVNLAALRNITVDSVNATGFPSFNDVPNNQPSTFITPGGNVNLSGDLVRVTGTIPQFDDGPIIGQSNNSIDTRGSDSSGGGERLIIVDASGRVNITHAGGPDNIPFTVGDSTNNGTAAGINSSDRLDNGNFPVRPNSTTEVGTPTGITISSVNNPPNISANPPNLNTQQNQSINITYEQLGISATDSNNDNIDIQISNIPNGGSLTRNGVALNSGDVIRPGDNLTYTPPTNAIGNQTAFEIRAIDRNNRQSNPPLSASNPIAINTNITPRPTTIPTPTPTPTPIPEIIPIPDPKDRQPDVPPKTGLPTPREPKISTKNVIDNPLFSNRERKFTDEVKTYLGLDDVPLKTQDDAIDIARQVEKDTGAKPAFVYINFVPEGINLLNYNPPPKDSDQLEVVIVTAKGAIRKRVPEVTRKLMLATVDDFRTKIITKRRGYISVAKKLHQWLISPVEQDLSKQKINNLVFLTVAGMRSLPFAALHDGKQFIIEKYSIGLMPSLSLTDTRYVDIRKSKILAMGVSESTEGQIPLPSVPLEVSTLVLNLWTGGRIFLNKNATLSNLQSIRQESPFGIIHMATHANFENGAISDSYIQLWNQKLHLDKVRQLGWNNPAVELLVLSACKTALGSEKAELGFAGMAVQTGVKTAVASLWSVDDAGTAALMTGFYGSLNSVPIKAEALRKAQEAMATGKVKIENGELKGLPGINSLPLAKDSQINNGELSHPFYWAAFTMVGNPW